MDSTAASDVTQLLSLINEGDRDAWDQLLPVVYQELRMLAAAKLRSERPDHTLQATALVNEVYLRLVSANSPIAWANRRHFFATAAEAMRRILVDAARRRLSAKRSPDGVRRTLSIDEVAAPEASEDLLALHEAIDRLAEVRPEVAELVKLRYFAGLTGRDAADCIGVAPRTADHYWAYAKVFLLREIEQDSG